jgi:LysM repeat protein
MKQLTFFLSLILSSTALFSQSLSSSPCPTSTIDGIHVVQPGETLYSLSKKYKVSIAQICQWNNILENGILPKCTSLIMSANKTANTSTTPTNTTNTFEKQEAKDVPSSYGYVGTQPKTTNTGYYTKSDEKTHAIVQGETLDGIANKYGYTSSRLLSMNNLASAEDLYVGQILKVNDCVCDTDMGSSTSNNEIPKSYDFPTDVNTKTINTSSGSMPTANNYKWNPIYARVIHIVSQNNSSLKETPASIGALYGLSESDVMAMNGLTNNGILIPNQRLNIEDRRQIIQQGSNINYVNPNTNPNNNQPSPPVNTNNTPAPSNAPSTVPNNTAMSSEEMQMVNEVNLVRSNPTGYIPYIEQYIQHLKENGDMGNSIATSKELIEELKRTPKLSTLQTLPCLYTAAKKHGDDQRRRGDTDHQGTDGSWPWDRVLRECSDLKDGNENLVGGPSDIRRAVILLLVDDGIDTRGHRKTMLQADWKYIACHKMGTIGTMPNCWVQQFGN